MKLKNLLLTTLFLSLSGFALAQQNLVYNHYFLNPFLYNPSYIAPNGYSELYLNYRKQWAGISGAPTTATLNLHLPINYKMGFGLTAYQDEVGVLRTTTGLLSYGYQVYLGKNTDVVHKLAFGLSVGMTFSYIPLDKVENGGSVDNALTKNNTSSMDGQFGLHYQLKNLKLSFALPRLFRTYVTSSEGFNQPSIEQVTSTLSSLSYNFQLSPRLALEPFIVYRTEKGFPSQYEAMGVLRISNIAWAGGSYRQDYGAAAFLGFNVKDRFKVGYAYEFAPSQVSSLGSGSHEFQLVMRLGKKKSRVAKTTTETPPEPIAENVTEKKNEDLDQPEEKEEEAVALIRPEETPAQQTPATPVTQTPAEETSPETKTEQKTADPVTEQPQQNTDVTESKPKEVVSKLSQTQNVKSKLGDPLAPGHYVVVGAFHSAVNARSYVRTLRSVGYPAGMSYYPEKDYYIVHMGASPTIEDAREKRNEYRRKSRYSFQDTWVLTIE
jgi:type IX secretion system PorP/SprF family membrane protein